MSEVPDDWRDRDVKEDSGLSSEEKETSIVFTKDGDRCRIHTDIATIIKWVQSVEDSDVERVRLAADGRKDSENPASLSENPSDSAEGAVIGVTATIPKAILKLQGHTRKSNAHSQIVSYGDLR